ncbi:symmetrical bis(5'-nucleosyl)-tetraphosphatase [soil metagenome]
MSTYAIGDLQGCHARLAELLARIRSVCATPRLLFVGDLVNRGPQSLATLRTIRGLGDSAQVVLGNHDLHLLAAAHGIRKPHRSDTLDDILAAPDRDELLDWLRHKPLAWMADEHLMIHAGVMPQWTATQTLELAHEVEVVLRGPRWIDFLREMYGNTPARWDDDLRGAERLRCIVNALTRMRYCRVDGSMDFAKVESVGNPLPGYMPWFDVPGRKTENVNIIFGHWSNLGLTIRPNLLGIDTGCVWGGKLTAICLQDRSVIQVACPQYQKPG